MRGEMRRREKAKEGRKENKGKRVSLLSSLFSPPSHFTSFASSSFAFHNACTRKYNSNVQFHHRSAIAATQHPKDKKQ